MYIKKIIIIYECYPHLITQNKQTKMRIMRMLALLNVAKSEVYQQEYKLSLTWDLVLLMWIISTMLRKKKWCANVMSPWRRIVWKGVGPTSFSGDGPFSKPLTCTTHYPQRKKNPVGQKCVGNERSWVVQPKFRSFGGLCTTHRCGIHWSEIDMLQDYNNGAGAATRHLGNYFRPYV